LESPFRAPDLTAADLTTDLEVIETLGWDGSAVQHADAHIARAAGTCAALSIPFDPAHARMLLAGVQDRAPLRLRLTVNAHGRVKLTRSPLPPTPARWRVRLAPARLDSNDPWLRHKTTRRALYDQARAALPDGVDEWIFANERGELCEGTITNLFLDLGDGMRTPPVACGLLPGILRARLLDERQCREQVLVLDDLPRGRLFVGNALRGLIEADLV